MFTQESAASRHENSWADEGGWWESVLMESNIEFEPAAQEYICLC